MYFIVASIYLSLWTYVTFSQFHMDENKKKNVRYPNIFLSPYLPSCWGIPGCLHLAGFEQRAAARTAHAYVFTPQPIKLICLHSLAKSSMMWRRWSTGDTCPLLNRLLSVLSLLRISYGSRLSLNSGITTNIKPKSSSTLVLWFSGRPFCLRVDRWRCLKTSMSCCGCGPQRFDLRCHWS